MTELGVDQSNLRTSDRARDALAGDQMMYLVNKDGQYHQISHSQFQRMQKEYGNATTQDIVLSQQ